MGLVEVNGDALVVVAEGAEVFGVHAVSLLSFAIASRMPPYPLNDLP